jgi:hypothetical protein
MQATLQVHQRLAMTLEKPLILQEVNLLLG